jgi:hypothetical protein
MTGAGSRLLGDVRDVAPRVSARAAEIGRPSGVGV